MGALAIAWTSATAGGAGRRRRNIARAAADVIVTNASAISRTGTLDTRSRARPEMGVKVPHVSRVAHLPAAPVEAARRRGASAHSHAFAAAELDPKWFTSHALHDREYGMSLGVLAAEDSGEACGHALWPRT